MQPGTEQTALQQPVILRGGHVFHQGQVQQLDLFVSPAERSSATERSLATEQSTTSSCTLLPPGAPAPSAALGWDATGCLISPGFIDLHCHLRQPGFEEKETLATGAAAAAAGGFTQVFAMPNLNPVPDDANHTAQVLACIRAAEASIQIEQVGAITMGEQGRQPANIPAMMEQGLRLFSDDGRGVQNEDLMRQAMEAIAACNTQDTAHPTPEVGANNPAQDASQRPLQGRLPVIRHGFITAHCEVDALLPADGVCVQAGSAFATANGWQGCSNESEWREIERNIRLSEETGCHLHICHASTRQSFQLVRQAKKRGLPVSCEVTPHNLLLSCDDILEAWQAGDYDDNDPACGMGRFKMNPPFRDKADVAAAVEALLDGTIDAIATDHAPHTATEKTGPFAQTLNGVVGFETAFAALYTGLVLPGIVPLALLLTRMTAGPAFVLSEASPDVRGPGGFTVLQLDVARPVQPAAFKTKGRSSPFAGKVLRGWPVLTVRGGQVLHRATGVAPFV